MVLKDPDSHPGECSNSWKAGALLQGEEGKKEPGIGGNSFYPIPASEKCRRGYPRTKALTPFSPQGSCRLKATHKKPTGSPWSPAALWTTSTTDNHWASRTKDPNAATAVLPEQRETPVAALARQVTCHRCETAANRATVSSQALPPPSETGFGKGLYLWGSLGPNAKDLDPLS